jgi:exonuclease SbcC
MRPRRLSITGFGSFREPTTLDFDGVDYFALVGPTGHGKSTIIDAIGFALYGQVPRYDDARVVNHVVSLGAQEARVELEFSVGADTYRVARVVKLRKGKPHQEGRLERLLPGGATESLAGGIRELERAIEGILRMPFGHFTKCVALPQGAFQQFLHDKPGDRRAVLVRLLNLDLYERLGQRARDVATERRLSADAAEQQLDLFAGATVEAERAAKQRLKVLAALRKAVAKARPRDRDYAEQAAAASADAERGATLLRALRAVRVPEHVAELGEHYRTAKANAVALGKQAARAGTARAEAEKVAAEHELEVLARLLDVHERLTAERTHLATSAKALKAAVTNDERVAKTVAAAHARVDETTAVLHDLRVTHSAHALVEELRVGEPCPVCTQPVATLPEIAPLAGLRDGETALQEAKRLAADAEKLAKQSAAERAAAARSVEQHRATIEQLEQAVAEHPDAKAVKALLGAAREAETAAKASARREREAIDAARKADIEVKSLQEQLGQLEQHFTAQRDPLIALEPPPKSGDDIVASWQALAGWAGEQVEAQRAAVAAATKAAEAADDARRALRATLFASAAEHALAARDLDELHTAAVEAETQARGDVERIADQRAQAEALRATVAQLREQQVVATELGKLLKSDQFIDWLVTEALATLVQSASALLGSLSNGAYSLRLDEHNEFQVVDHANADETRSVRTLSGGETFQAALALALALSDQLSSLAADGAPRLEAMFLDEGFGTLDAESLDVVASTIETLGTSGRMVGIITHVRELAERVPVRFEVRKIGRTSCVEMVTT